MAVWTLYARNSSYERVGEIDTAAEFKCVLRFNDVGSWTLTLAANSPSAELLALIGGGSGVILRRDNETVMSGPLTTIERGPFEITYSGVTDEIILADRLALPVEGGESYTAAEFDYRLGVASTSMRQYVNQNTSEGGGSTPDRAIPAVSYPADPVIGNTIEARARFVPLLELLQEMALAGGGLRFRLTQSDETPDVIYFYVEEPALAEQATFSAERGNLESWTDLHEGPSVNAVYAGGRGLNENRPIVESVNQDSVLAYGRRVERFLDARETDDDAEILQQIATELEEGGSARVVKLTTIDTPATTYFEDYNLGDLAVVEIEGTAYTGVIREVAIIADDDGVQVNPTIASPGASADGKTYRQTRELTRRVARLERNGISIPDGSITVAMLPEIDTAEIADGAITQAKMADNSVGTAELRNGEVTAGKLASGASVSNIGYTPARIVTGSFVGDGTSMRTITLPFTPQLVFNHSSSGAGAAILDSTGVNITLSAGAGVSESTGPGCTTNGFIVNGSGGGNGSGITYNYVAIG